MRAEPMTKGDKHTIEHKLTGKSQVVPPRDDQPKVKSFKRGSIALALAAADTEHTKNEALKDLRSCMYSAGGEVPREVQWRRWTQFHSKWFGDDVPPLPLTMVKVEAVGAMFRRGKYRSFKNYLSMAADQHIMQGHTMTKGIERMMNKVRRAVERGQGLSYQSLPSTSISLSPSRWATILWYRVEWCVLNRQLPWELSSSHGR